MVKQILEKIEKDKLLHFVAGVLIYQGSFWLIGYYALLLVLFIAVLKEAFDHLYGGMVDVYDIIATMAGGLIVSLGGLYGV